MALSNTPPDTIALVDLRPVASLGLFPILAIGEEHPLVRMRPSLKRRLRRLSAADARRRQDWIVGLLWQRAISSARMRSSLGVGAVSLIAFCERARSNVHEHSAEVS
jgi:hypothetical protein